MAIKGLSFSKTPTWGKIRLLISKGEEKAAKKDGF